jgi:murein L,D-transpeptidase YcbB/YkuD
MLPKLADNAKASRARRGLGCLGAATMVFCVGLSAASAQGWTAPTLDQLKAVALTEPDEGLPLESTRLARLDGLRSQEAGVSGAARAEVAQQIQAVADSLFARIATDFAAGRLDPRVVEPTWHITPAQPDIPALETQALATGNVADTLRSLLPHHPEYRALVAELAKLLAEPTDAPVVDGFTRNQRIGKVRAALERWRWAPHTLPARHLEVHVPEFHVVLMQNGEVVHTFPAIVGKTITSTPSFAAKVTGVILNPYWEVPNSIARNELAPKFRRDPGAAKRGHYQIVNAQGQVVSASSVNWKKRPLTVHIRQVPGDHNALGHMKLQMTNPYSVYLHDTPAQSLFERARRAFSHGCIRVKGALILAQLVLNSPEWGSEHIDEVVKSGVRTEVPAAQPLPVYVLYLTANRAENGPITYAKDLYGRDKRLLKGLSEAVAEAQERLPSNPPDQARGTLYPPAHIQ